MIRVLKDRESAENSSTLQDLAADGADDVFESQVVGVRVIALRARELAQSNSHHLEQAALDGAGEVRVPLHAAD